MTAILKITNGYEQDAIDLLSPWGFLYDGWRPSVAEWKGGGVWKSSSMSEGRRLAHREFRNAIEKVNLKAKARSPDVLAERYCQKLNRTTQRIARYWIERHEENPTYPFFYLMARSEGETNIRYAIIHKLVIPEFEDAYGEPFLQQNGDAVMDRLTVLIERGHWSENVPGAGTCVQLSAAQDWEYTQTTITSQPAQPEDDGFAVVHPWAPVMDWNSNHIRWGTEAAGWDDHAGIRFPSTAIPQGAEILSASISFEAWATDATNWCKAVIYGEDVDNAAIFSSFQNFMDRPKTDAFVNYPTESSVGIENWTIGNFYNTPELKAIIQEIVNRTGWSTGNALVIFLLNDNSTVAHQRRPVAWEARPTQSTLTVTYVTTQSVGRIATCNQEVYAANKHNMAQLSHVYRFDASGPTYTDLMGVALPYELLPNPMVTGDIIYYGCNTALENSGPFSSLVQDIGTAAIYTGNAGIIWEYWNGAWTILPVQDNTRASVAGGTGPFSVAGVNSVHWEQPPDWATTAINGITAYWVRARVVLGAGTISTPTQQNRHVYTICWGHIDIDEAQLPGEIEALGRLKLFNESDFRMGTPNLWANRIIVGRRAISRGEDFRAYINLADEQNLKGLEILVTAAAATMQTDTTAPAGRNVLYDPTGPHSTAWGTRVSIYFKDDDLIQEYRGTYRCYVRVKQISGDTSTDYVLVRLGTSMPGSSVQILSDELTVTKVGYIQALDLGEITIPLDGSPSGVAFEWFYATNFHIQASVSSGHANAYLILYDFILIPTDEWVGEFVDPTDFIDFGSALGTVGAGNMRHIDIDSISHPKEYLTSLIYQESASVARENLFRATLNWRAKPQGPLVLQEDTDQRFWVFAEQHTTFSDDPFISPPYHGYSAQAWRNARYLHMRGSK